MIHLYYPERDSTIYERYPNRNTGIDQILELTKIASGSLLDGEIQADTYNSRILIDFGSEINALAAAVSSGDTPPIGPIANNSASVYLTLKSAYATDLPTTFTLYAFPISQSWVNGNGNYNDIPEQRNGVSWYYRDNATQATAWATGSAHSSGDSGATILAGGGTWITGSGFEASQSFAYGDTDMRMDVTDIVKQWVDGTITNYGFIIKRSKTDERSTDIQGSLKFFGLDTHTIYVPRLEVVWKDTVLTGVNLLTEIVGDTYVPYIKNIRNEYRETERAIFRLAARQAFPARTYTTTSNYMTEYRLPTSSYYSIIDSVTNETIIPFDTNATQISCDINGSFFKLRLNTFQPERYYKILLKIERSGGSDIQTFSEGFYFKVVR